MHLHWDCDQELARLHSKLATGQFPDPHAVAMKLKAAMEEPVRDSADSAATRDEL